MFDFDTKVDRSGTNALKWEVLPEDGVPMWVADMDFAVAPAIAEAVAKRAAHPVYGYSLLPKAWANAYSGWWQRRHGFSMDPAKLSYATGVMPAIFSAVRRFSAPGEGVILMPPVYHVFYHAIEDSGRLAVENELLYENGDYHLDMTDLKQKITDPRNVMLLLCNPHNPTGKIWDRETLAEIGKLCRENGVLVVSDEIHCDLTDPGKSYVPFASVSDDCRENSIICIAPSKSFNIAGLCTAAVYVENEALLGRMRGALGSEDALLPNAFAADAAIAAYNSSEAWLDALREYVHKNKELVRSFLREHLPELHVIPSEATYMLWVDFAPWMKGFADSLALRKDITAKTGLYLSDGTVFRGSGTHFMRINLACPRTQVEEALGRLLRYKQQTI